MNWVRMNIFWTAFSFALILGLQLIFDGWIFFGLIAGEDEIEVVISAAREVADPKYLLNDFIFWSDSGIETLFWRLNFFLSLIAGDDEIEVVILAAREVADPKYILNNFIFCSDFGIATLFWLLNLS